jgi:hypothetical protein
MTRIINVPKGIIGIINIMTIQYAVPVFVGQLCFEDIKIV